MMTSALAKATGLLAAAADAEIKTKWFALKIFFLG